jgi:hypothetical protein
MAPITTLRTSLVPEPCGLGDHHLRDVECFRYVFKRGQVKLLTICAQVQDNADNSPPAEWTQ